MQRIINEMSRKELTMKARRIIMTCFAAIILMVAMPVDVLAYRSVTNDEGGPTERDRLTDISRKEGQKPVAMFSDTQSTARACLARPQRLLPSHGSTPGKMLTRYLSSRNNILFCNYKIRSKRQDSTPVRSFVSRNYYVIALRHIIC